MRRVPLHVGDDRLIGGLDIAATMAAGRPVYSPGLLAEANQGVIVLVGAERLAPITATRITAAMDTGAVAVARDGFERTVPSRFAVVALDEGDGGEERMAEGLLDRLALRIDLGGIAIGQAISIKEGREEIASARARLGAVTFDDAILEAVCATAAALGVHSARGAIFTLKAARALAALAGQTSVSQPDAELAARLVLAPRATCLPASAGCESESQEESTSDGTGPKRDQDGEHATEDTGDRSDALTDALIAASTAALPADVLARLRLPPDRRGPSRSIGRFGVRQPSMLRGRPAGVRCGEPSARARIAIVDTLRAAAPWQRLRRSGTARSSADPDRIQVRRSDFRIARYKSRAETVTIFVVDASGSSALHRLGEAKGAVELLLADCYVRRDSVALVAFRGTTAEILLQPTRSLARVKRSLAALPGGGGTPLAAGLDLGHGLAEAVARKRQTPSLVVLTDGRANIARSGVAGRAKAEEDAEASARGIRARGVPALLIDTSPKPRPEAERIANAMAALYLPLPHADAASLARAVRRAGARSRDDR
jgi:magnesium chelatase subunit D